MKNLTLLALAILFIPSLAYTECKNGEFASLGDERLASAGLFGNVFSSGSSLRSQLMEVYQAAEKKLDHISPKKCLEPCKIQGSPRLRIEVAPNKLLSKYSDIKLCAAKKSETSLKNLSYKSPTLDSAEEFGEWFASFSQGKGKIGEKLYQECPGACSPSYKVGLEPNKDKNNFFAQAKVICSHARDKSDNQYLIRQYFVWECS